MLEKIFGSKARVKILKFFLFNAEKRSYIREIARNLDLQVNSARRELKNLEDLGLLITSSEIDKEGKKVKKQEKYYVVNKKFVLFEELRSLIIKAQVLHQKEFEEDLKNSGNLKLVVLTGMFVESPQSKIDLLVVGQINRKKLKETISSLEKNLGREINYTFMSVREFKYRREITDVFLYDILENKKIIVVNELDVT
ncbi:winged helix-turn-helix domain-containing protein [bacterium]|nr:winged helix-turn-helix domain-containing protein [bacterium]